MRHLKHETIYNLKLWDLNYDISTLSLAQVEIVQLNKKPYEKF